MRNCYDKLGRYNGEEKWRRRMEIGIATSGGNEWKLEWRQNMASIIGYDKRR